MSISIKNIVSLKDPSFAKVAKATATTVYFMTLVKAGVRPVFNLRDKKSDEQSRKYSAMNEFLYQVVCLGMAAALMPICERQGYKLAEKRLSKILGNKNITKLEQLEGFKKLADVKGFGIAGSKKVSAFKDLYLKETFNETKTLSEEGNHAMHLVNGGVETGSFVASIVGLTLLAPMIGHQILHPIMHAIGMNKKQNDNIGKPTETFLADAKVPTEKTSRLNANA